MTKQEETDLVLEYMAAGMTKSQIAAIMKVSVRYINSLVKDVEDVREFARQWATVTALVRRRLKHQRQKGEEDGDIVFRRVSSRGGYWWLRGYDYRGPDGGGPT